LDRETTLPKKASVSVRDAKYFIQLMTVGLVVPSHLIVSRLGAKPGDTIVADTDLSSGQWQLLSLMLGLSLSVEDDSLVLIDEPENSLHPDWQRSYVELLRKAISNAKRCHVVIATHSPLVASGVQKGRGNVLQLLPSESEALGVKVQDVQATYGWDANDVYEQVFDLESTRASSFVELTDQALSIVRDGNTQTSTYSELVDRLRPMANALPLQDPMRLIVDAITKAADGVRQ
jgi:predicted ATP-binding protein involved in virulence